MEFGYHWVTAVDVEGFSRLSVLDQIGVQGVLRRVLDEAALRAALDRGSWYRQARGDGELAVLPRNTDVLGLVAAYPLELARGLASVNADRGPGPRIRLRLAVHHGTVVGGPFGPVGPAPILVSRLVDADGLRRELRERRATDLVFALSSAVYAEVVESRLGALSPEAFHSLVVRGKGADHLAYVHGDWRGLARLRPPAPDAAGWAEAECPHDRDDVSVRVLRSPPTRPRRFSAVAGHS
ncbi:hypothetical protein AGRA3207_006362 [Actinomadura graeca]|uniref:Uncharacterized protein n=1 Tax=Actinomadura graeca TaxID=2750812 RepID=A0ABX8R231_9ACTN|nr:hypothetical protein [Actinomadura graeca]QXJ24943.1 hypothetical protein AGRA3207_006362 [Actinomadura graeca]